MSESGESAPMRASVPELVLGLELGLGSGPGLGSGLGLVLVLGQV